MKKTATLWKIGDSYFIRTVTHYLTGRLVAIDEHEVTLTDAAWIASTGRYSAALSTGNLDEVEPYPKGAIVGVGRGSIVDVTRWGHALPSAVK